MELYGIPNCNTVKKARNWLDENSITYQFHDFKKQGIDVATLAHWISQQPWQKLINRAGMTWRNLTEDEKAGVIDNVSAIKLMQEKTSVIKRPLLVDHAQIIALGFDETTYRELFTK